MNRRTGRPVGLVLLLSPHMTRDAGPGCGPVGMQQASGAGGNRHLLLGVCRLPDAADRWELGARSCPPHSFLRCVQGTLLTRVKMLPQRYIEDPCPLLGRRCGGRCPVARASRAPAASEHWLQAWRLFRATMSQLSPGFFSQLLCLGGRPVGLFLSWSWHLCVCEPWQCQEASCTVLRMASGGRGHSAAWLTADVVHSNAGGQEALWCFHSGMLLGGPPVFAE